MELQPVRIDATDVASPKVEVAGVDVSSSAERVMLVLEPGVLPKLVIEVNAFGLAEAVASVVGVDTSALPNIREWLDALDPEMLESAALEEFNGLEGGATSTGESFLMALKKLAP